MVYNQKEDISALGTTMDIESHQINLRCDDDNFQATVQKAHDNIEEVMEPMLQALMMDL